MSLFVGESCVILKNVLKWIQVDNTYKVDQGRFINCDSTTHLMSFVDFLKSDLVKKQIYKVIKVQRMYLLLFDLGEATGLLSRSTPISICNCGF